MNENNPKYSTEEWIVEAKNKKPQYIYTESVYVNKRTKVKVICEKHGAFFVNPNYFLQSESCICPKCQEERKNFEKNEKYLKKVKEIYKDKDYEYNKFKYNGSRGKVTITCKKHGDFTSKLMNIIFRNTICPKCAIEENTKRMRLTFDDFKEKAEKIHNGKYVYHKNNYNGYNVPMDIMCPIHGSFIQRPHNHLSGQGCPKCGHIDGGRKARNDSEEFKQKCIEAHKSDNYSYEFFKYTKCDEKVAIYCHNKYRNGKEHGIFYQLPISHLNGQGCPICRNSNLERIVACKLLNDNVNFIPQYKMDWLGKQSLDFFLLDYKVGIECQGSQHFMKDKFMKELEIIKSRDLKKKQLCKENGVKLIYFLDKRFNKYMKENDIYFNDVDELVKYIKN